MSKSREPVYVLTGENGKCKENFDKTTNKL